MMKISLATALPVVEVPPELRGMSDEDIIKASESRQKKMENGFRLSKKERDAKKILQAKEKLKAFGEGVMQSELSRTQNTLALDENKEQRQSEFRKKLSALENETLDTGVKTVSAFKGLFDKTYEDVSLPAASAQKQTEVIVRSSISEAPKPASGRVLCGKLSGKFAFGQKKIETKIVNAVDLERERADARAKTIQKNQTNVQEPAPKRPRGRPRKNPLPEVPA